MSHLEHERRCKRLFQDASPMVSASKHFLSSPHAITWHRVCPFEPRLQIASHLCKMRIRQELDLNMPCLTDAFNNKKVAPSTFSDFLVRIFPKSGQAGCSGLAGWWNSRARACQPDPTLSANAPGAHIMTMRNVGSTCPSKSPSVSRTSSRSATRRRNQIKTFALPCKREAIPCVDGAPSDRG